MDGQKVVPSGNRGQEEETAADRKQDGWMTSGKQQVQNGRGRHKIGENGRHLQRATSCSGWTKPPSNLKLISNQAFRQARALVTGLEPATEREFIIHYVTDATINNKTLKHSLLAEHQAVKQAPTGVEAAGLPRARAPVFKATNQRPGSEIRSVTAQPVARAADGSNCD
ncbi:hypothetical protein PoB_001907600 [Plakobranchus ocellatus]|uniref:Uncharacterized protein n=1 Tax=Plakobranchus ocellatus TaxID=259542 RepID=A0AAV3YZR1_9GAST|nr:hypothetical protein PoB_001907600 [Plakobranchus ocellatus]